MNLRKTLAVAAIAFCAGPAFAAGYLKIGDIKGESTQAAMQKDWIAVESARLGETSGTITTAKDPVAIGLLLPAVQKVRAAAGAAPRAKRVGYLTFSEGARGKTYWLKNVLVSPGGGRAGANVLQLAYDCMNWRDRASGETGGSCAAARKKGKVEAEFKVEKGEK